MTLIKINLILDIQKNLQQEIEKNMNEQDLMAQSNKDLIAQANKTVEGIKLLSLEIRRDNDCNLLITLKGNEKHWSLMRRDDAATFVLGGIECFAPKADNLLGVPGYFIPDNIFEYDNKPNMAMFLAKNLSQGVTFNFGQFPISNSKMYQWKEEIKKQAKIFFLAYVKPVGYSAEINTINIEQEKFD